MDKIIFWAIHESGVLSFAKSMYYFNVISKDIFKAMKKIYYLERWARIFVLSQVLMEGIKNPKGYNIFKESLKKKNSLIKFYHQINFVG